MYFGDRRIFFQLTGRYSVSSGGAPVCFWLFLSGIPDISMSTSFLLNHMFVARASKSADTLICIADDDGEQKFVMQCFCRVEAMKTNARS